MNAELTYPLAKNAIFPTIQGEGAMLGTPMVFVRLAGCSIGCAECDTDYRVVARMTIAQIMHETILCSDPACRWVWLTGGEPTDHNLEALVAAIRSDGFQVALATAGTRRVDYRVDFLSVSPHSLPCWVQREGDQLNLVPGLNGMDPATLSDAINGLPDTFPHRYITPCDGQPSSREIALAWVRNNRGWRLGVQAHKHWGLP